MNQYWAFGSKMLARQAFNLKKRHFLDPLCHLNCSDRFRGTNDKALYLVFDTLFEGSLLSFGSWFSHTSRTSLSISSCTRTSNFLLPLLVTCGNRCVSWVAQWSMRWRWAQPLAPTASLQDHFFLSNCFTSALWHSLPWLQCC
jgi:hypothetical protein